MAAFLEHQDHRFREWAEKRGFSNLFDKERPDATD